VTTDIVRLVNAGTQTLTFTEAIANPVFAFVSLNANGYAFLNQDFNILSLGGVDGNACGHWGCGGAIKNTVTLPSGDIEYQLIASNAQLGPGDFAGSEPHGTIQFLGAFSSLEWRSLTSENWNAFTVGIQGTADEVFPDDPPVGAPVPEPTTMLLVGSGLVGVIARARRKRL
jgi:hypothetical protein